MILSSIRNYVLAPRAMLRSLKCDRVWPIEFGQVPDKVNPLTFAIHAWQTFYHCIDRDIRQRRSMGLKPSGLIERVISEAKSLIKKFRTVHRRCVVCERCLKCVGAAQAENIFISYNRSHSDGILHLPCLHPRRGRIKNEPHPRKSQVRNVPCPQWCAVVLAFDLGLSLSKSAIDHS